MYNTKCIHKLWGSRVARGGRSQICSFAVYMHGFHVFRPTQIHEEVPCDFTVSISHDTELAKQIKVCSDPHLVCWGSGALHPTGSLGTQRSSSLGCPLDRPMRIIFWLNVCLVVTWNLRHCEFERCWIIRPGPQFLRRLLNFVQHLASQAGLHCSPVHVRQCPVHHFLASSDAVKVSKSNEFIVGIFGSVFTTLRQIGRLQQKVRQFSLGLFSQTELT